MSKKYIIEIENKPLEKKGCSVYKAVNFNTLVFDDTGLKKLKLLTDEECINHLHTSGWLMKHDEEVAEEIWELSKELAWKTRLDDLKEAGLLSAEDAFTPEVFARNSYKEAQKNITNGRI